ncbi:MAG: hypothetical protein CK519_00705 [Opitutia bacterium]|nr:MAG: hypothetical protein CK519_00705 [Opitutae bacterium]
MARQIVSTSAAVIRVTGSDAASFLQGQCSADLTKTNNVHALWLNRKGRVLAHTLITKEADQSFLILCPHLSAVDAIAVMSSNLIADDVTLTDETSQWKTGIVWGDAVPNFESSIRFWPSARTSFESWQVLFPKDISIEANESDISFVEKNRIESGIPSVPEDCGASEFPQECGLDDWVSYNKGCYLGQEVMARIQSMGSLRRSLRQISATEALRGDIELKSPGSGKIVGTMKSFMGKTGLALVSIDCAEGTTLDSSIGPVLVGRLVKLPKYS